MKVARRFLLLTMLVLAATRASAATSVSLVASPFQDPGAGKDVVVAVAVSQASGVTSMDFAYAFNPSVLTPTGVFLTGFTSGFSLGSSLQTPGLVQIHLARPTGLFGSGEVAWVTFRVANGTAAGTITSLAWSSASLNAGAIPCGTQGMSLAINSAPATIGAPLNAFGLPGSQVTVPITATGLVGGSAFDVVLTFDPNVVSASSVHTTPFASCLTLVSNVSVPGTVRVALYGAFCNVSGTGSLVNITFDVVGPSGSRTPLNVTRGEIEEEGYPSVLADGLFNVCGVPDGDGDGYSVCAGDCNDANTATHPGAVETCNSVDDDCNTVVDDAVVPTGIPNLGIAQAGGDAILSWAPIAAATNYDIVRGALASLASSSGDFSQSVNLCLGDNVAATSVVEPSLPAADAGFWYLVRPSSCGGAGSYDGGGSHQASPRDAGIGASPYTCP